MRVLEIYIINLGKYSDKYLVTGNWNGYIQLRRGRTPKTKIDGVRLPEEYQYDISVKK